MKCRISDMVRGTWCDFCKKMIYVDVWGHAARHAREKQMEEDARAAREESDGVSSLFRKGCGGRRR